MLENSVGFKTEGMEKVKRIYEQIKQSKKNNLFQNLGRNRKLRRILKSKWAMQKKKKKKLQIYKQTKKNCVGREGESRIRSDFNFKLKLKTSEQSMENSNKKQKRN